MKIKRKPRIELLYKDDCLCIPFEKGQLAQLQALIEGVEEGDYDITIKKRKLKRSLDANAYFWTLIQKLAFKLGLSYLELYKEYIRDYGVYIIVPVREDKITEWVRIWGRSDSWICEDIGECKTVKGYHNIKSYYGTSVYDTKQMSRMIDAVVGDCNEQGIETLTPNEITELFGKEQDV